MIELMLTPGWSSFAINLRRKPKPGPNPVETNNAF